MHAPYYRMSVPIAARMLRTLDGLLSHATALIDLGNITEAALLDTRLAPDMFPFEKQVQVACDNAKGMCARLAGMEPPVFEDTETTIAALHTRVATTLAFIESIPETAFEGAGERTIRVKYFPGKYFRGHEYLTEYALPNFFFHVTTVYNILRMKGAPIGKANFIGPLSLSDDKT